MKKVIFSLIFLFVASTTRSEECSCGSFEAGIYDFSVQDDTGGCCKGVLGERAWLTTWKPGPGRTWIVVDIVSVKPIDAQRECCPAA